MRRRKIGWLSGAVICALLVSASISAQNKVEVYDIDVEKLEQRDVGGDFVYLFIRASIKNLSDAREVNVPLQALDKEGNVIFRVNLIGFAEPLGFGDVTGHISVPKEIYSNIEEWKGE